MLDRWSLWCKGATEVIIVGFLLAALGVGLALGHPGPGALVGLGLGLVFHYLIENGWIAKPKNNRAED